MGFKWHVGHVNDTLFTSNGNIFIIIRYNKHLRKQKSWINVLHQFNYTKTNQHVFSK